LAIYSSSVNAGCPLKETLADSFPWCDEWEAELKRLPCPLGPVPITTLTIGYENFIQLHVAETPLGPPDRPQLGGAKHHLTRKRENQTAAK
jgi:DNA helicase-2/ATP-dependent DNA helicase PcrA